MADDERSRFADWYRQNHTRVLRFVERRLDDRDAAADVTSEVFRIAWAKRVEELYPEAWLYRTARNLLGNEYRRRSRAVSLQTKVEGVTVDVVADPADAGDAEAAQVREALATLRERDREILRLAYWDDLDGATIAEVLGCSVGSVWTRLHRARAAFETAYRATE